MTHIVCYIHGSNGYTPCLRCKFIAEIVSAYCFKNNLLNEEFFNLYDLIVYSNYPINKLDILFSFNYIELNNYLTQYHSFHLLPQKEEFEAPLNIVQSK